MKLIRQLQCTMSKLFTKLQIFNLVRQISRAHKNSQSKFIDVILSQINSRAMFVSSGVIEARCGHSRSEPHLVLLMHEHDQDHHVKYEDGDHQTRQHRTLLAAEAQHTREQVQRNFYSGHKLPRVVLLKSPPPAKNHACRRSNKFSV